MACCGGNCDSCGNCGPFSEGRYPLLSNHRNRLAHGAVIDVFNRTLPPYHVPGYCGTVRGSRFSSGKTFGQETHDSLLANLQRGRMREARRPVYPNSSRGHEADLRARLHMVQGEIDPNPCANTEWNIRSKFCIDRPMYTCPDKLAKRNQHGYTSRLSVYDNGDNFVSPVACKPQNLNPCPERIPIQRPFLKEYEEVTNYDPFQEYPPECRHLRLPPVKPKSCGCWDEDFYIPVECLKDYQAHGYVKKPTMCECMPLDAKKPDSEVCYLLGDINPCAAAERPYFQDPTNCHRWFKSGYTGHCPVNRYRIGETYDLSTRNALNTFTTRYMFDHLGKKFPKELCDPSLYCCDDRCYERTCCPRLTYDGHFHEERIRRNLPCRQEPDDDYEEPEEPLPICIAPTQKKEQPTYAPC